MAVFTGKWRPDHYIQVLNFIRGSRLGPKYTRLNYNHTEIGRVPQKNLKKICILPYLQVRRWSISLLYFSGIVLRVPKNARTRK